MAEFAVDVGREVQVVEVADLVERHQPGAERAGRLPVLALGDVELGVANPVADRAFVAEGETGDVLARTLSSGIRRPALPMTDDDLALVVELLALRRADAVAPWLSANRESGGTRWGAASDVIARYSALRPP